MPAFYFTPDKGKNSLFSLTRFSFYPNFACKEDPLSHLQWTIWREFFHFKTTHGRIFLSCDQPADANVSLFLSLSLFPSRFTFSLPSFTCRFVEFGLLICMKFNTKELLEFLVSCLLSETFWPFFFLVTFSCLPNLCKCEQKERSKMHASVHLFAKFVCVFHHNCNCRLQVIHTLTTFATCKCRDPEVAARCFFLSFSFLSHQLQKQCITLVLTSSCLMIFLWSTLSHHWVLV